MMKIRYEKATIKYLKGLQWSQRELILRAIEKFTHYPVEGNIQILCVMDIGSRGDIYK